MSNIHASAVVHPDAQLGTGVIIGPFCTVGPKVKLGDNVKLISHVVVDGDTTIGDGTIIYPFASVGMMSMDLKFQDESTTTGLRIGKNCKIREYATIHSGTPASDGTEIGDNCQIMVSAHIGHDCKLGNGIVLSNLVQVAGHVEIEDYAIVSAGTGIHQFCRVGRNAFIGGFSGVIMDVPPYAIFEGKPAIYRTINKVGLLRAGLSNEDMHAIHKVYSVVFAKGSDEDFMTNLDKVKKEVADNKYAMDAIDFVLNRSKRGAYHTRVLKNEE